MMEQENTQESEARFWRLGDRIAWATLTFAVVLAVGLIGRVYFELR